MMGSYFQIKNDAFILHPKMFRKTSSNNLFLAPNFIPTQTKHPVVPRKGKIKIDAAVV